MKTENRRKSAEEREVMEKVLQEKGMIEKEERYLISETAKLVGVESHVLRYWEDELKLPIRRNELGHRYYTKDDVEQFIEIKKMKEQGLQLKAIRTVLTVPAENVNRTQIAEVEPNDKAMRLQMLLHGLISQAVRENNEELVGQIKESVIKELDYQFRVQEEENERRNKEQVLREEEHYRQLDEKLRELGGRKMKKEQKKQTGQKEKTEQREQAEKSRGQKVPGVLFWKRKTVL